MVEANKHIFVKHLLGLMRSIYAVFILLLVLMTSVHCQQTAADWLNKGNDFYKKDFYDLAIKCYDNAIEIDPNYTNAWTWKGNALSAQGKYDDAIKCYDEVIRIDPNDASAWDYKCSALNSQGMCDEAIKAYDKAKELGYVGAQNNTSHSCEPFCDDLGEALATGGQSIDGNMNRSDDGNGGNSGNSSGSTGVSTSKKKTASYGEGNSDGDQSNGWTVRSFLPVRKATNNPLTQAASEFSDVLQDSSAPGSDIGSVGLKVEDNDVTGEERYTLYRREAWQDSSSNQDTSNGWTPIHSQDAGTTLKVMGYKAPDSTKGMFDIFNMLNMLSQQRDQQIRQWQERLQREALQRQSERMQQQRDQQIRQLQQDQRLGGVDFSSISLNYISMSSNSSGEMDFNFVLKAKKAGKQEPAVDLNNSSALSAKAFLTCLAVSNSKLWVNLNPWEPDRIIDKDLEHTDTGRIMLEADLLMKKDFCMYADPCNSTTGLVHWKLLENKRAALVKSCMERYPGEIKEAKNVLFSFATRHWIVPGEFTAYGNEEEIYVDNPTMTIRSDPVSEHTEFQIVNQDAKSVSRNCLECLNQSSKEYGRYAKEIVDERIMPLVVQNINRDSKYADLRQIYIALGVAQYYKDHRKPNADLFFEIIKSHNLTGVEIVTRWDPKDVWNSYVKSYKEGEYRCWQNKTTTSTYEGNDGSKITRTSTDCKYYQEGGVDFTNIKDYIKIVGELSPGKKETLKKAIYALYAEEGDEYYFGDGIYLLP